MKLFQASQDRDTELLSAYLDNQLSSSERTQLERRLQTDSKLRSALNGLRLVKTTLTDLPAVKPPRNFRLTPAMAGKPARSVSPFIPVLNWATAVAATLFAVLIGAELSFGTRLAAPQAAPASEVSIAQAPEAANAADSPTTAEGQDALTLKSTTETPSMELMPFAAITESPVEPLAGAPETGVGGAGGEAPPSGTETVSALGLTDSTAITPTPDESALRSTGEGETEAQQSILEPTPVPTPDSTIAREQQEPASAPSALSPLRLAQVLAALALIVLVTASFLLRRR